MSDPAIENIPRGTTAEAGRTRMSSGPSALGRRSSDSSGCETAGLVAGASTAPLSEMIWVEAALDSVPASRSAFWTHVPGSKPGREVANAGAGSSPMGETASGAPASLPCSRKAARSSGAGAGGGGLGFMARRCVSRNFLCRQHSETKKPK